MFTHLVRCTVKITRCLICVNLRNLRTTAVFRFMYYPERIPRSAGGKFEEFICTESA